MHTHIHCEHDLKCCPICDIVYCTKCHKEWILPYLVTTPTVYYSMDDYIYKNEKPYITVSTGGIECHTG